MDAYDIERIFRDLLTSLGMHVTILRIHRVGDGWAVIVTDQSDRIKKYVLARRSARDDSRVAQSVAGSDTAILRKPTVNREREAEHRLISCAGAEPIALKIAGVTSFCGDPTDAIRETW